jgi:hypothetical protein
MQNNDQRITNLERIVLEYGRRLADLEDSRQGQLSLLAQGMAEITGLVELAGEGIARDAGEEQDAGDEDEEEQHDTIPAPAPEYLVSA